MAAPAIPSNYNLQTANAQNYLSWSIMAGATSYSVMRSEDGTTYSEVDTPAVPYYLDSDVVIGSQYWYKVASVNGDGTSSYTIAQSCVPVTAGEMSLGQIRLSAQQRADRVNSNFVSLTEWNSYINQSLFELYDLLVTAYGEEYFAATPAQFNTNGSSQLYPLPNGVIEFTNGITQDDEYVAPPFYKLLGVDLGLGNSNNGWVTLNKFNFIDRNKYFYPNSSSTTYGVYNMSYRLVGNNIEFIPTPNGNQPIRLWYIPRMTMLLADIDITTSGISGWIEYIIVDAAIKALQKEESDVSVLAAQKMALIKRIEGASMNRDAGAPDTISNTRGTQWPGGEWGPGGGFNAGF